MQSNIKDNVIFATPKNEQEREFIAGACVRKLGIKIPAVLDEFGNGTEKAYTGWPDRLYLIDGQGHIALKTKPGPFGFDPKLLASALAKVAPGDPAPVPPAPPAAPKPQAALVTPTH
jgi:type I thyroxine 5'-deiodinase